MYYFIVFLFIIFKKRDAEKLLLCEQIGTTLIQVPYFWDRKKESLMKMIKNVRADLFVNNIFI